MPPTVSSPTFFGDPAQLRVCSVRLKGCLNLGLLISLILFGSESPGFKQEAAANSQRPPARVTPKQDWPLILARVRSNALAYSDRLPDFICNQTTRQFIRSVAPTVGWKITGSFVAELAYYDRKEHYEILSVNRKPVPGGTTMENLGGGLSIGEFGSALRGLFEHRTQAEFRLIGPKRINRRKTLCIAFEVSQERSKRFITLDDRTIMTAYRGRCWVNPDTYEVVRLEKKSVAIPREFPVTQFDMSVDYAPATISGASYWLPKEAEIWISRRPPGVSLKNFRIRTKSKIRFDGYRRFGTGVKLVTE